MKIKDAQRQSRKTQEARQIIWSKVIMAEICPTRPENKTFAFCTGIFVRHHGPPENSSK